MRTLRSILYPGILGLLCGIGVTPAAGEEPSVDYRAMLLSTVSIRTINFVETDYLGDSVWTSSAGSGVVVSVDPCEIWTNYHVVSEAAVIEVFPDIRKGKVGYPASLHNANPRTDLAILQMDDCPDMVPARFSNSDKLQWGNTVFAVGNPTGHNPGSISRGIISHTRRAPTGVLQFVQTDAAVSAGSSGGGLFNRQGELVAMTSAVLLDEENQSAGFAYAVPVNLLKRLMDTLRDAPPKQTAIGLEGKLATLGVEESLQLGVPAGQSAVIVVQTPYKPPSRGVVKIRDVIYEVNGNAVSDIATFNWMVGRQQPGASATLSIVRSGKRIRRKIAVVSLPIDLDQPRAEPYAGHLGLRLADWADKGGDKGYFQTPVITGLANLGPAHYAGIRSNQHYLIRFEEALPVIIEVKSISGVIKDNTYVPVESSAQLNRIAAVAAAQSKPLILEVQNWLRNPLQEQHNPFKRQTTSYHLVKPRAFPERR